MAHSKMSTNNNNNAIRQEIDYHVDDTNGSDRAQLARLHLAEPDSHCQTLSNRWARAKLHHMCVFNTFN